MLITGPPGSGKGTVSKRLVKDFPHITHLSSGDMLRAQVAKGTTIGNKAKAYMSAGDLVPDEVLVDLVLAEVEHQSGPVLLDGFPRTLPQALALEAKIDISLVLSLEVPSEEIVARMSDRWVHESSGRVYSYAFNPPQAEGLDDETKEPLVRRSDDEPDKVRHRLEQYESITKPLLGHFDGLGRLHSFSGDTDPELVKQDKRTDAIYNVLQPVVASSCPAADTA